MNLQRLFYLGLGLLIATPGFAVTPVTEENVIVENAGPSTTSSAKDTVIMSSKAVASQPPIVAPVLSNDEANAANSTTPLPAVKPTTVNQQALQGILNNWRASRGIPGATLSIYLPEQTLPLTVMSGTTTYAGPNKINSNTLFQAGSITKSFTSMIILQLEAQGKLRIDDSIAKYLPQYPQWREVTIRQLLNHTSGIFNYTEAGAFNQIRKENPRAEFTSDEILHIAGEHGNYFPPGKGWKYSNTNYILAGLIIQAVTKEPISDVMNHYLHGGLRLNLLNTYYLPGIYSNAFLSHMAHGYSSAGSDVTTDNMSWAYTAGAIVTTTQDLLSWWRSLFQGNLLPSQQLSEMMSLVCEGGETTCRPGQSMSHLTANEIGKGYGLGVIQSSYGSSKTGTVWWHNGSTAGYKAIVMWFPQSDIYMALTINRDPGYLLKPDLSVIRQLLNVLIPHAEWHLAHARHLRIKRHHPVVKKEVSVNKTMHKPHHLVETHKPTIAHKAVITTSHKKKHSVKEREE